jgi:hypothetical protein
MLIRVPSAAGGRPAGSISHSPVNERAGRYVVWGI